MGDDPCSDMIRACLIGDVAKAKELIAIHDLSQFEEWYGGYRLLRDALEGKHRAIAKLLLESGSRVNSKDEWENSPLHLAVLNEDTQIVSMLLKRCADVDAKNYCQQTALYLAVEMRNFTITELLLRNNANVNVAGDWCRTPLYRSVEMGNLEITKLLLRHGSYDDGESLDGTNSLFLAIACKNIEILEYLLNSGPFVNSTSGIYGNTPLHHAVVYGNKRIVELLMDRGADVNARNNKGLVPLHVAAAVQNDDIVEVLLKHNDINADVRNNRGKTVLSIIIEQLDVSRLKEILKIHPKIKCEEKRRYLRDLFYSNCLHDCKDHDEVISPVVEVLLSHDFTVFPEDASNRKFLHAVVDKGCTVIMKILLQYGADVESSHAQKKGYTLLHHAVNRGQLNVARTLIDYGANVNAIDGNEKSPISYAIDDVNIEMIKLLASSGAKIKHPSDTFRDCLNGDACLWNIMNVWSITKILMHHRVFIDVNVADGPTTTDSTVTHIRIPHSHVHYLQCDLIEYLLSQGADVNAKNRAGHSLLYRATMCNFNDFVEILLKYNADVDIATPEQMSTPLHLAAAIGNEPITRMLIAAGAVVNAKDKFGQTALRFACKSKDDKVVAALLESGASIEDIGKNDTTPLHIAASNGSLVIVKKLLKEFADVECTNKNGHTPLYLAMICGQREIVEELLNYGADVSHIRTADYYIFSGNINELPEFDVVQPEAMRSTDIRYNRRSNNRLRRPGRNTVDVIMRHIVMLKSLNGRVETQNQNGIDFHERKNNFQIICECEVEMMKREKIGATNISYYDILIKSTDQLAILMGNESIADSLKYSDYHDRFPIYSKMLHYNLTKGQHRGKLLNPSTESLNFLFGFVLPKPVSWKLLDYLNNDDLINVIEAGPSTIIVDKSSDN
uniref:Ankyrin repeat domain protein n=1 Tax=Glypta fumiferanae TaxID=389681 RepID=A0A0F6Q8Q8_9HYME|nr:ankyrin repeat domain protein [Glypta fumiferanae]